MFIQETRYHPIEVTSNSWSKQGLGQGFCYSSPLRQFEIGGFYSIADRTCGSYSSISSII
jgi:hypothetical protein